MGSALRQVWTIACHSVLQAVRMRVVIVLAAFLLILVPAMPFLLESDKTHAGQLRIIMTYSIYLISFLLSVLTLFLSAITLNTEIKNQHIFLLDPKPVARGTVLAGKWLGVMLIVGTLLAAMLGVSYGLTRWVGKQRPWETPEDYAMIKAEVLSARRAVSPPRPDLAKWVNDEVEYLKKNNLMPKDRSEEWVRQRTAERLSKGAWRVPPGGTIKWEIRDVPKSSDVLLIRFRHYGEAGSAYDYEIPGQFVINESGQPISRIEQPFRVTSPHSFGVPSSVVRPDGVLEIRYTNKDESVGALFPFQDGIQVLYSAGSLLSNFVRVGAVILIKLAFIATMGVFASTFLSFPVAVLLSLSIFTVGHLSGFIFTDLLNDLYIFGTSMVPPGTPMHEGDIIVRTILGYFFSIFPDFSQGDVVPLLTDGLRIEWNAVTGTCFSLLVVRGIPLAVAGWYIYRRRELAALTAST